MEVLQVPDERLRLISSDIAVFDDFLRFFVDTMIETMYECDGIGLAAPQVGVNRNVIVVDPSAGDDATKLLVMINPKIVSSSGSVTGEEGCLSIEGIRAVVERFSNVKVEYYNVYGEKMTLDAEGFLAVIIQHEIDHLHGVLFTDRVSETRISRQRKKSA